MKKLDEILFELDKEILAVEEALTRLKREKEGAWEHGMKGRLAGLQSARGILFRHMRTDTTAAG